jgi:aquaporin Z
MNKYIAELLGTFVLALAVGLSLAGKFPVPTPVVAGLTLMICVYTLGAISGAHINPAITIGLLSIGKISVKDAVGYLVAQFAGAGLAISVRGFLVAAPTGAVATDAAVPFVAEILGTFWLAIGVASVVHGSAPGDAAGVVIGGSLLLGIAVASQGSNGVLNPAVALGIGSVSVTYLLAPILGSVAAMWVYRLISGGPRS